MGRTIGHAAYCICRQEQHRRILIVELIGKHRYEVRHPADRRAGVAGEDTIGTNGAECNAGARRGRGTGQWVIRGNIWRVRPTERRVNPSGVVCVVGRNPRRQLEVRRDKEAPLVMIRAFHHRHLVEIPALKSFENLLREHFIINVPVEAERGLLLKQC